MWIQDIETNQWYRTVSSGFLNLTFVIKTEDNLYVLGLLNNKSSDIKLCSSNIAQAKQQSNDHIRHAFNLKRNIHND